MVQIIKKDKDMYSLECSYYKKQFNSLNELIKDVINSGMDPDYNITINGKRTDDVLIDLIYYQSQFFSYIHV